MLLELFTTFFKIGMFTIGGGYAMLPIIQREVVETKGWMTDKEFLDSVSLTNSLPGPLATNAATFIGYKIKGVKGSIFSILGVATPSIIIIIIIASLFKNIMDNPYVEYIFKGARPAVVALILFAIIKLCKSANIRKPDNALVAVASLIAIAVFNIHPIIVIFTAALYGIFIKKDGGNAQC